MVEVSKSKNSVEYVGVVKVSNYFKKFLNVPYTGNFCNKKFCKLTFKRNFTEKVFAK